MRPLFTIHAGEFLVGQHIERKFKRTNVWVPTKDVGVDLLVTNATSTKAVTLQVKFSRDFLPIMKLEPSVQKNLRSCTWFTLDRKKLEASTATLWVLVLLGFEKNTYDYVVIKPGELKKKLESLHGNAKSYQTYIWVTKHGRAWLTRGISKQHHQGIAMNTFSDASRDLTDHLDDWDLIEGL
jgi:hypothetical protein